MKSEIEGIAADWVCQGWDFAQRLDESAYWRDLWLQFDAAWSVLVAVGRQALADEFFFLARIAFIHRMGGAS